MSIQVIERASLVLDVLAEKGDASLAEITEITGLKKTTLLTIIQSLVSAGLAGRAENGNYTLGPKLQAFALILATKRGLKRAAADALRIFVAQTGESAVVSVISKEQFIYLVQAYQKQELVIESNCLASESIYETATGRVLLSALSDKELEFFVRKNGLPQTTEWQGCTTITNLKETLLKVRTDKMVFRNSDDYRPAAMAMPVHDHAGAICAAIGATIPTCRASDTYIENIGNALANASEHISKTLSLWLKDK
ncbi:MAG: helix-turn-helix domain-containing protein [Planctomycetes bacterium]|nr:helix-turn-helix domain-containing protein [Planctomycetota bacterium]